MSEPSFWTNESQTKYYLIPTSQPMPKGDLVLHTLTGQKQTVDAATVAGFEISEEEAKPYIQVEMRRILEQAGNAFVSFLGLAAQEAGKRETIHPPRPPSELVTSLLGFTPDKLRQNPDLAKEGVDRIFNGVKDILEGAASGDPTQLETARGRMRSLRAALQEHGIETDEVMEQIPDNLRQKYISYEQKQGLEDIAGDLRTLAGQLDEIFTAVGQNLREQAAELEHRADQIGQERKEPAATGIAEI